MLHHEAIRSRVPLPTERKRSQSKNAVISNYPQLPALNQPKPPEKVLGLLKKRRSPQETNIILPFTLTRRIVQKSTRNTPSDEFMLPMTR